MFNGPVGVASLWPLGEDLSSLALGAVGDGSGEDSKSSSSEDSTFAGIPLSRSFRSVSVNLNM